MDALDLIALLILAVLVGAWRAAAGPIANRHRMWWAPMLAATFVVLIGGVAWEIMGWRPLALLARGAEAVGLSALWIWLRGLPAIASLYDVIVTSPAADAVRRLLASVHPGLNLSFLAGYLVVRVVIAGPALRLLPGRDIDAPPVAWFFVEKTSGGTALRPSWTFSRALFRTIAVVVAAFTVLQVSGATADLPLGFGPGWSVLSLLVVQELAFLFAAEPAPRVAEEARIAAAQPGETTAPGLSELADETRDLWDDWLIASGTRPAQDAPPQEVGPSDRTAFDVDGANCRLILESLWSGRSVLVQDVLPHRVKDCIAAYVRERVAQGERVFVLVSDQDQVRPAIQWCRSLFRDDEFNVTTWEGAFTEDPAVIVATLRQNLFRLFDRHLEGPPARKLGAEVALVVALEAQSTVLWHGPEVDALTQALTDLRGMPPQFLGIGEWRDGADEAYGNIVGVRSKELQFADAAESATYLVWRLDAPPKKPGMEFFQEIFRGDIGAYVSPETALAIPAVGFADHDILLVQQHGLPFRAFQEDAGSALRVGQIDDRYRSISSLDRTTLVENDWEVERLDRGMATIIGRSGAFDIVAAVRKWLPASDETLVQIVSPPYLLRAYHGARFAARLDERRGLGALAPGYVPSPWRRAYTLYRRLERGWVDVGSIVAELRADRRHVARNEESPDEERQERAEAVGIEGAIRETLEDQLELPGEDVRLEFTRVPVFVRGDDVGHYEDALLVRLVPSARDARPSWHRRVDVVSREQAANGGRTRVNGTREVLVSHVRGHLHQNLLPGQQHAFGGDLYEVGPLQETESGLIMHAERRKTSEYRSHYRICVASRVGAKRTGTVQFEPDQERERIPNAAGSNAVRLELVRFEVPITVETDGYYVFEAREGIDLVDGRYEVVDVEDRTYRHGKLLRARLWRSGATDVTGLAPTLALLLQEMLPSFFPEVSQYLRVVPSQTAWEAAEAQWKHDSAEDGEEGALFLSHFKRLVPGLNVASEQDDGDAITVYIVEDSPFDLGALGMLMRKLDNILEELKSYLAWRRTGEAEDEAYLRYGFEHIPRALRLFELAEFLQLFQGSGPSFAREAKREGQEPETGSMVDDPVVECDFCGRSGGDDPLDELDDGRHRCVACEADGVNRRSELRTLYIDARRYFQRTYGYRFRERIRIEFVTAKQLAEYRGMTFSPGSGYDVRSSGLASTRDGVNTIHIENGFPLLNTQTTIVHELAHIWQREVLTPSQRDDEDYVEGQAVWVHLRYQEDSGHPNVEWHRQHYLQRQDEYGRGYRIVLKAIERFGLENALDVTRQQFDEARNSPS